MPLRSNGDKEEDDSGVQFAQWGKYGGHFYTGASDGVVKVWDISRGDPFVKDMVSLDAQIMSGAFSPNFDMLMLGDASGRATLLSHKGDKGCAPSFFDVDMTSVTGLLNGGVRDVDEENGPPVGRNVPDPVPYNDFDVIMID
jgi:WD40 repeat protein